MNATYLVAPIIGWLIDRTGFLLAATLLIVSMQALILTLWAGAAAWAQWAALALLAGLAGTLYTIQYAYLTMAFPAQTYPGLLTVTFLVQGTLGFVAWPLLSEVRPFGADPATGNFVLILVPSILCYAWPLSLGATRRKPHEARASTCGGSGDSVAGHGAEPVSPAVSRPALQESLNTPRPDPEIAVVGD